MNICKKTLARFKEHVKYIENGSFEADLNQALELNKKNSETEAGQKIGESFILNKFGNKLWIYKGIKSCQLEMELERKEAQLLKKNPLPEQIEVLRECFSENFREIEKIKLEDFYNFQ